MRTLPALLCLALLACALAGCSRPMGVERVDQDLAYRDISGSILGSDELSSETRFQLHRHGLDLLLQKDPDSALRRLQDAAIETKDRDLLFALAETSFSLGERQASRDRRQPYGRMENRPRAAGRDPQDYYLGAAVYAYLFLFSPVEGGMPIAFDRRFRTACELYNFGLGWALTRRHEAGAAMHLAPGLRDLPAGGLELSFSMKADAWKDDTFEKFLMADQYRVIGLSARNRQSGLGAPLIAVTPLDPALQVTRSVPGTVFLRVDGTLAELAAGTATGSLELYSAFDGNAVTVGGMQVPLELDSTIAMAHTLSQESVWSMGRVQFLSGHKAVRNQLFLRSPYQAGMIPVVLVHGTFSSPIWWAEMLNTLAADPILRTRFQFWTYMYGSSNPILISGADFRDELKATVERLDPQGKDPALRRMVVIGHSQGGLLTKLTATHTGDRLWKAVDDRPLAELHLSEAEIADISRLFILEPLPFVTRTVFISTPHRGSFQSGTFARRIGHWLITLPVKVVDKTYDLITRSGAAKIPEFLEGNVPTSLDGMSPHNPVMLALADIPLAPGVVGNSIVAVAEGGDDIGSGDDGVVKYASAHVDYVESELVVRQGHSCQDKPETIEEVRRILHRHLAPSASADQQNK